MRNKQQNLEIKLLQPAEVGPYSQIAASENTPAVAGAIDTTSSYTHYRFMNFTSQAKKIGY